MDAVMKDGEEVVEDSEDDGNEELDVSHNLLTHFPSLAKFANSPK